MNKHEAFAGILLAATAADGVLADEEVDDLVKTLVRMKMFSSYDGDRLSGMLNRLLRMICDQGVDAMLDQCVQALPAELHKTAFINACDLVMADGVVEEEEQQYINRLWKALGISPQDAKMMSQVIVLKNRG